MARVIGRAVPLWWDGTCRAETVQRVQVYGQDTTLTVEDTATAWPATRERFAAAVAAGMPDEFPQAFAADLADHTTAVLAAYRELTQLPGTAPSPASTLTSTSCATPTPPN